VLYNFVGGEGEDDNEDFANKERLVAVWLSQCGSTHYHQSNRASKQRLLSTSRYRDKPLRCYSVINDVYSKPTSYHGERDGSSFDSSRNINKSQSTHQLHASLLRSRLRYTVACNYIIIHCLNTQKQLMDRFTLGYCTTRPSKSLWPRRDTMKLN